MAKQKVFSLKCRYCKKKIISLWEKQVENNLAIHEMYCIKRGVVNGMVKQD